MGAVERIKIICKSRKIPISRLERDCGFANGYIRGLREDKIPGDRLFTVADYLGVTPEYLLTGMYPAKPSTSGKLYYFDDETAEKAQELFENPDMKILFDAARDSKPDDLMMAADLLRRLKETNPDG